MPTKLTRREVLIGGAAAAGALAAGAGPLAVAHDAAPKRLQAAPAAPVAVRRCPAYEPKLVHQELTAAVDALGGLGKLVRGKTVTVKLNLTGNGDMFCGLAAARTYQIHPGVVAALCAIFARSGARRIVLVESMYFREPPEQRLAGQGWGIAAIASAGDHLVTFENSRNRGSWSRYSRLTVPRGAFLYPAFDVNARYHETDVFVSLAKLKEHSAAGLTCTVKNLFGMPPMSLYGNDAPDEGSLANRMDILHDGRKPVPAGVPAQIGSPLPEGEGAWKLRVPRITVDCLGARPVDLAVIDGIETVTGGAGPWERGLRRIAPRLLLAGRNAVCTDAVAAAVMGFDPDAAPMQPPFPGENHLRLAAFAGLGSNDLSRIEVLGIGLDEARHPFRLSSRDGGVSGGRHEQTAAYRWDVRDVAMGASATAATPASSFDAALTSPTLG